MEREHPFLWKCQPEAEKIITTFINECCEVSDTIRKLRDDLKALTSSQLLSWVDHICMESSDTLEEAIEKSGFVSDLAAPYYRVFRHPGAQLPAVVLADKHKNGTGIAVAVDSIANFLMCRGLERKIEGSPLSAYRRCCVSVDNEISLWAVERRGTLGMEPTYEEHDHPQKYIEALERWKTRPRSLDDEDKTMEIALQTAEELVDVVGCDMAAWIVLEGERDYWQMRNGAGQIQKSRQDHLGMGWANHDHHTFRSSRKQFHHLVRLFEILGFYCRERFYAGTEAGWGAQVMENHHCGLVLFLDVDLAPQELEIDFTHHELSPLAQLGSVGLWCALHGDSLLKAGMHHLEAQFIFATLTEDLAHIGVGMMDPFSDFSYLKQAFTAGEVWPVDPQRVEKLLRKQLITQEEAERFLKYGAVGSHLENLQRKEGYKGFNQKNVSVIIKQTDPRTLGTGQK